MDADRLRGHRLFKLVAIGDPDALGVRRCRFLSKCGEMWVVMCRRDHWMRPQFGTVVQVAVRISPDRSVHLDWAELGLHQPRLDSHADPQAVARMWQ